MNNVLMTEISAAIRYRVLDIRNRSLPKHLAFTTCVTLIASIFMTQLISAQATDPLHTNSSAEQVMARMKERLHLTEEQETKIRPIIEESVQARHEILEKDSQDRSTIKNELQELQWKTDMRLGVILTEEQMKEYEKLREEQSEKMQRGDVQGGVGPRGGRSRGF
jgi:Spy/CpxP family protein refolding chaperone